MLMSKFLSRVISSCLINLITFRLADIIHRRTYDFILRYDVLFKFTPTYRRQQQLIKKLHVFTDKVIVSRREKLQGGGLKAEDARRKSSGDKKKIALLDLLLLSSVDGKPLTNKDIREEIDTFMFEVIKSLFAHILVL